MSNDDEDLLRIPTDADRERLNAIWTAIQGAPSYQTSPQNRMDIWVIEHRVRSDRLASARLTRATWVLVVATVALFLASAVLVYVTAAHEDKTSQTATQHEVAPATRAPVSR